jgi:hypothetical protein
VSYLYRQSSGRGSSFGKHFQLRAHYSAGKKTVADLLGFVMSTYTIFVTEWMLMAFDIGHSIYRFFQQVCARDHNSLVSRELRP